MSYFIIDVESDGPLLGVNSMVCFGAIKLQENLENAPTFYAKTRALENGRFDAETLAISGFSREEHEQFPWFGKSFIDFDEWINENNTSGKPVLLSDNNGYDASWINWYFIQSGLKNPFGWSSRRIGDMFCGFFKNDRYAWKKHRITKHNHDPVDDARGNAEAMLWLVNQGYKMNLK